MIVNAGVGVGEGKGDSQKKVKLTKKFNIMAKTLTEIGMNA